MDDILNSQDDNLGGLQLVQFAPLRFFQSLSPVSFFPDCDWINLYVTPETSGFSDQFVANENGGYRDITITGAIPNLRPEVSAVLEKYRGQRLILQTLDNNGRLRLAGSLEEGLVQAELAGTGTTVADPNGYTLQFKGQLRKTPLFL